MAKLNKEDRVKLVETLRYLYLKGMKTSSIKKSIKQIFNVNYSTKSLLYYKEKAFKEEWKEVLEEQNKVIDNWNHTEPKNKLKTEELLAEAIFDAVKLGDNERYDLLENYNENIRQAIWEKR